MLRPNGYVVVVDLECAFDESGTHGGSPFVCVAGYVMEKDSARALEREWNGVLNWDQLPRPLRHFHMADCAPDPGNAEFAGLTKQQRIQLVARMIGVIKRNTKLGVAVTVNVAEYEAFLKGHPFYPDPYVVAAHVALVGIFKFIRINPQIIRRMAYFFESGHKSQSDANALMQMVFRIPHLKETYAGHAFIPKLGNPIVQAADLLAWQWAKDRKNTLEGRPRRKDLQSLLAHRHNVAHVPPEILAALAENQEKAIQTFFRMFGDGGLSEMLPLLLRGHNSLERPLKILRIIAGPDLARGFANPFAPFFFGKCVLLFRHVASLQGAL